MKVLVVGGGGREHALAWKLAQHHAVYCAPGNPGIARRAECVDIRPDDLKSLAEFAAGERIELTVVGPEAPLVAGIADRFGERGLTVFGPSQAAARLEGDKSFAKRLMRDAGIPTAEFGVFDEYRAAKSYLDAQPVPVVIKASGLAAGKGVIVCASREEAGAALAGMMKEGRFGDAGRRVVIEECLVGEEASIIGLCDGVRVELLASSQDHKRLEEEDRGPNTGGMGAYSPAPAVTTEVDALVRDRVFEPLLAALGQQGIDYRGAIYAGIMVTADGPKVLEFNCRFGDPETQAVLPLVEGDLGELMLACAGGELGDRRVRWSDRAALCVVLASGGYPGGYAKGVPITGDLFRDDEVVVFHAGTRQDSGRVVTAGGRVLGVTGIGRDLRQARDRAYDAVGRISFDRMYFREDIGHRGLSRRSPA